MRPVPTGRGYATVVVIVALLAVGRLTGSPGALPLAVGLAAQVVLAPLVAWIGARRIAPGLKVRLRARPALVAVGHRATLELRATHGGRRPVRVGIDPPTGRWVLNPTRPTRATRLGSSWWRAPGPAALVRVVSGAAGSPTPAVALDVPTARRAVLELAPLRVWYHDPAGLVGVAVTTSRPVRVVVHPPAAPLEAGLLTGSIGPASSAGGAIAHHGGSGDWGGDFAELRPYRVGDRLTSVHWQALARYGVTLVRQFDPEAAGLVRVVVDDRAGAHHRHTYEDALAVVEGLIEASVAAGLPVELSTFSGRSATVVPTPAALAQAQELLAGMGPRPSSEWSHLDLLISEFGGFTLVTTATGAPRLPDGLARRAHVVTAG